MSGMRLEIEPSFPRSSNLISQSSSCRINATIIRSDAERYIYVNIRTIRIQLAAKLEIPANCSSGTYTGSVYLTFNLSGSTKNYETANIGFTVTLKGEENKITVIDQHDLNFGVIAPGSNTVTIRY